MATTKTPTAAPVLEFLDPRGLLVDRNVRVDTTADRPFIASIKDYGVLQPVIAVRTDDGIRVRHGHRRTLGAIAAQRHEIPVLVIDGSDDEAERILTQVVENHHRAELAPADFIGAAEQLAALGLTAEQMAKRTRTPRGIMQQAAAAAGSELARKAATRYDLTLDQAATLADFEADPEAVKALVVAAKTGQFDHVAQRLRDERADRQRRDEFAAALAAAGLAVIAPPDATSTARRLDRLTDADGRPLDPDTHRECPGHAVYLTQSWGYVDPATGQPLPEDYDPDEEGQPEATWDQYLDTVPVCTDPDTHGHHPRALPAYSAQPTTAGPLTAEQKAERQQVRERNKQWRSAETVRREWLKQFLTRKTAPKGTTAFIARTVATGGHALRRALEAGHPLAATLLGADTGTEWRASANAALRLLDKASDARATVVLLGVVLAALEDATDVHTWRSPDQATAAYFRFLAEHGYQLAEVEQLVTAASPAPVD